MIDDLDAYEGDNNNSAFAASAKDDTEKDINKFRV